MDPQPYLSCNSTSIVTAWTNFQITPELFTLYHARAKHLWCCTGRV